MRATAECEELPTDLEAHHHLVANLDGRGAFMVSRCADAADARLQFMRRIRWGEKSAVKPYPRHHACRIAVPAHRSVDAIAPETLTALCEASRPGCVEWHDAIASRDADRIARATLVDLARDAAALTEVMERAADTPYESWSPDLAKELWIGWMLNANALVRARKVADGIALSAPARALAWTMSRAGEVAGGFLPKRSQVEGEPGVMAWTKPDGADAAVALAEAARDLGGMIEECGPRPEPWSTPWEGARP